MVILDPINGVRFGMCKGLDDFYREIDCTTIDIARRSIAGNVYDIYVDDEGLLKADCGEKVSAVRVEDGKIVPQLVGTLVFANHDSEGNTTDLSLNDMLAISSRIKPVSVMNADTGKEEAVNYCVFLD